MLNNSLRHVLVRTRPHRNKHYHNNTRTHNNNNGDDHDAIITKILNLCSDLVKGLPLPSSLLHHHSYMPKSLHINKNRFFEHYNKRFIDTNRTITTNMTPKTSNKRNNSFKSTHNSHHSYKTTILDQINIISRVIIGSLSRVSSPHRSTSTPSFSYQQQQQQQRLRQLRLGFNIYTSNINKNNNNNKHNDILINSPNTRHLPCNVSNIDNKNNNNGNIFKRRNKNDKIITNCRLLLLQTMPLLHITHIYYGSNQHQQQSKQRRPKLYNDDEYNDDEGPDHRRRVKLTEEEEAERRQQIRFQREEKKQFYRSNDGMWVPAKKQFHRAEIVRDHFRAEETYKQQEHNDYVRELTATRRMNILERKDKKMMGEDSSDDESNFNPFPSTKVQTKIDKELKGVVDEREKKAVYHKYAQKQEDEMSKRLIWVTICIFVCFIIPWDSRNPDLPF